LTEVLTAAAVIVLFAALLLPILTLRTQTTAFPGQACQLTLRALYQGLRAYFNDYDEYLPLAWHVGGTAAADDLSNLSYHRFLILERVDTRRLAYPRHIERRFRRLVTRDDIERNGDDQLLARQEKYKEALELWRDPTMGWTRDYFSPDVVFPTPRGPNARPADHRRYSELTREIPSTERPIFADVNASLPDPEAKDPADPGHEQEMRRGFSVVSESGVDVFVGTGPSLRVKGDYATARFDFRHKGMANVMFLDGHAERIGAADKRLLQRVHERWNQLHPRGGSYH
jgi:prepilin-type processing-associated H-X9-DG protein